MRFLAADVHILMLSADSLRGDVSADEEFVDKLAFRQDIRDQVKEKLPGGDAAHFYRVNA